MQSLLAMGKNSRQVQRVWEGKLLETSWVVLAGNAKEPYGENSLRTGGKQAVSFQQNLQNVPVGREKTF